MPKPSSTQNFKPQTKNVSVEDKKQKRGISLNVILSTLIFLAVAIAAFFYFQNRQLKNLLLEETKKNVEKEESVFPSPTADLTTDWETYRSEWVGFEVKLPDNWYPHETSPTSGNYEVWITYPVDNPSPQSDETGKLVASLAISRKPLGEKPQESLDEAIKSHYTDNGYDVEKTKVNDRTAIRAVSEDKGQTIVYVDYNDFRYSIQLKAEEVQLIDEFDQILSTFRFIENPKETKTASPTPSFEATPSSQNL